MRRKQGTLVPLEMSILEVAKRLKQDGIGEFYGFQIASRISSEKNQSLVGYGTLYRALGRLVAMGLLTNRWEVIPEGENRPRRRYYRLVGSIQDV